MPEDILTLLSGDNFFRLHPDKVLGQEGIADYSAGKPGYTVEGSMATALHSLPDPSPSYAFRIESLERLGLLVQSI